MMNLIINTPFFHLIERLHHIFWSISTGGERRRIVELIQFGGASLITG